MTPRVPYTAMSRCCERSSTTPETTGRRWRRSVWNAVKCTYVRIYVCTYLHMWVFLVDYLHYMGDGQKLSSMMYVKSMYVRICIICNGFIHHGGTASELWYIQCYSLLVCVCACAHSRCIALLSMGQCAITYMYVRTYLGVVW